MIGSRALIGNPSRKGTVRRFVRQSWEGLSEYWETALTDTAPGAIAFMLTTISEERTVGHPAVPLAKGRRVR